MSVVIRLSDERNRRGRIAFNRYELHRLLSVYSRRVMAGEWRDYAIDMHKDGATFSVFRHTTESALYTVWKTRPAREGAAEYTLFMGPRRLARSRSLDETLRVLDRRLRIVS
jgi:hypothetical protein